jgi:hypothetical protein
VGACNAEVCDLGEWKVVVVRGGVQNGGALGGSVVGGCRGWV